ncbi:MAG: hypothetical protein KDA28_10665, partial [Phycisphaerales bacterium]|nr:hypothetical protein [Phycisphaerales bacterium]
GDDLRRYLEHEPITARHINAAWLIRKKALKHPVASSVMVTGLLALVAVASLSVLAYQRQIDLTKLEARNHARTRMMLANAAIANGDLSRAAHELDLIPDAHRDLAWTVLESFVDQDVASFELDEQGIVDLYRHGSLVTIGGHSGRVWQIDLDETPWTPTLVLERKGVTRSIASTRRGDVFLADGTTITHHREGASSGAIELRQDRGPDLPVELNGHTLIVDRDAKGRPVISVRSPDALEQEGTGSVEVPRDPGLVARLTGAGVLELARGDSGGRLAVLRGCGSTPVLARLDATSTGDQDIVVAGDASGAVHLWRIPDEVRAMARSERIVSVSPEGWLGLSPDGAFVVPNGNEYAPRVPVHSDSVSAQGDVGAALFMDDDSDVVHWVDLDGTLASATLGTMPDIAARPLFSRSSGDAWFPLVNRELRRLDLATRTFDRVAEASTHLFGIGLDRETDEVYVTTGTGILVLGPDGRLRSCVDMPMGGQFLAKGGEQFVAISHDGRATVWDAMSDTSRTFSVGSGLTCVEMHPDGTHLFMGRRDGTIGLASIE